MSTINRLSSVDALQPGDLIPVWDGSNGDTRKASLTTLLAFIESNFADPDYSTRIVAPNVDGFNVDIGNTGDSSWLIVNPTLNYTTGSITLPSTAYAVNDQEITVVFTAQVSSFSITGAGATVLGAPTQIGTYDSFRVRYNAAQLTWYTLDTTGDGSGSGTSSIVRQDFTGDGVVTTFALANAPAALGNELQVFIDGVYQERAGYSVSGNNLVFSEAPPVLSTIEVLAWGVNDIGATTANLVTYTPAGTGAVATTVQDKLRESVSVLDFGAVGDGIADDSPAFRLAITASKNIFVPSGTYLIGSNIDVTTSATFVGEGVQDTYIHRGYSPAQDYEGIFAFGDGASASGIRNMTLLSKTGQTGGCLVSIKPTSAGTLGLYRFDNVDFTTDGTSTHAYTIYMDGTAKTSTPIGIRGVDFTACNVFGGSISTMLIKGVLKFSFVGGGTYPAGGAATSNIRLDGTASVPTSSFLFLPSDCSCPISFDYAEAGTFGSGLMGAITNTANTNNITGFGFSASVQNNWDNSTFLHPTTGITIGGSGKISNVSMTPSHAVEMLGNVTGYSKPGTVTQIGQAGIAYQTNTLDGEVFTFTPASAKLFTINTGGGAACLVFADYKQTTIGLVSNPSSEFEASASPAAGKTGLYKSANDHVISLVNNTGSATNYSILVLGSVSGATDPA
jgi:hypothetical protein